MLLLTIINGLILYIITQIYGTPVGTTGYSGRYMMDTYDYIIQGHHQTYTPLLFTNDYDMSCVIFSHNVHTYKMRC